MELIENIIKMFDPKRAAIRQYWRLRTARLYEAAGNNIYHKRPGTQGSADKTMDHAKQKVRDWARHLDENHDLAIGILDELVNKVVGVGINPEPIAAGKNGKLDKKLNRDISIAWRRWSRRPEVTGELPFSEVQRLGARTTFRDGEVMVQHIIGSRSSLIHLGGVPYSIEMIECDFLPFEYIDEKRGIYHGVEKDAWGRPRAYHLLKASPDRGRAMFMIPGPADVRRIEANLLSHVKFTRRFQQTRGISVFHGVAHRLDDIKDYEESERIAARIDASFAGFIRKGTDFDPTAGYDPAKPERQMEMQAGIIFDNLLPGEDVGTIGSNRPNANLMNYRNGQLKALAAGTGTSYSSISKNYDGTYSAQRQELVESYPSYSRLRAYFISAFLQPIYENFITAAVLSGAVKLPAGVDMQSLFEVEWIAPPTNWVDPKKEVEADALAVASGFKTRASVIRDRTGKEPSIVMEQIEAENNLIIPSPTTKPAIAAASDDDVENVNDEEAA